MTSERRFEHDLPELLADLYLGPAPDYRHDIVQRVARTPQRRAWTFPERWLPMGVITLVRRARTPLPWRTIGLLAVLALLIASLVAIYVGSSPRVPDPFGPARNGLLAYEEAGDIVVLDEASGSRRVLVAGATVDTAPAFSRDGTQLAFLRQAGDRAGLWAIGVDGSNARQLAAGLDAFVFEAGPTSSASIEWSPDGRSILLSTAGDQGRGITVVATDGSNSVRALALDLRAEGPTWRPPAGDMILFRGRTALGYGLYTVRPDGSGLRELVPAMAADSFDALFFGWSPDGEQVVYQAVDPSGPRLLFVVGADGSNPHPITDVESVGAAWSPDGTAIAFFDASDPAGVSVAVVGADGSGLRKLVGSSSGMIRWTPDGTKILQVAEAGGSALLLDPGGGPSRPVSGLAGTLPDWQRLAP